MRSRNHRKWLEPDGLTLIAGWARDGLTDDDIAARCGISPGTLTLWKRRYPGIADTLRSGRDVTDYMAENALLKRALGYDYTEETWEFKPNKETGIGEMQLTKKQVKHLQPDVSALQFWLKKRRKHVWGDMPEAASDSSRYGTGVIFMPPVLENEDDSRQGGESK